MTTNNTKQVAIIGAGIIGINCAIALQKRGYEVTVFDHRPVGEGCSKANAGHFATEQVFPLAEFSLLGQLPYMLLNPLGPVAISMRYFPKAIPWFCQFIANMRKSKREENTKALRSLNERAIASYQSLLQEAKASDLFINQGSLLVFENTPLEQIKQQQKRYLAQDVKVELLNKAQLKQLEPNISDNINYALHFTEVAHTCNPLALTQALAKYACSIGVKLCQEEVSAVNHYDQGINLVTAHQTHCFDKLVLATGAWSKKLTSALGYRLPIESERGYSLDLPKNTANTFTRPIASAERKFIITPMRDGLRLAGTAEFAGLTKPMNVKRVEMLYNNASYIIKDIIKRKAVSSEGWVGCRPSLPDSLPVIGKAPKHENIILALGHQHLGLTLGAITGTLVGQIIDNDKTEVDIRPFCISRFN
ncbi:FAD-binding oxidoreductase [Thalassotalea sp. PP2-459]|uniref:NAD(P)/FAD-dependent oxidoreductase n=1 Tax=Thalassotalea sp. PP2-459 TaxID=1742724 RepID=UPI0009459AA0|nr:FAD-dependent oxidoreductase [Thalassotalea sp. PP2-459]OKY25623.1 amino acid dehydrogenase [Thalassotalea sp. PP2-459]